MYMNTVQSTEKCNFAGSFTVATLLCPPFFFSVATWLISAMFVTVATWLCPQFCYLSSHDYVVHFVLYRHMIMSFILFSVITWLSLPFCSLSLHHLCPPFCSLSLHDLSLPFWFLSPRELCPPFCFPMVHVVLSRGNSCHRARTTVPPWFNPIKHIPYSRVGYA